ncbi:hypothetical protein WOLCODRAFT_24914 [Wolfiporia cocos MD-104 SS10]|uniref:Uncharacterized protein n=1 Tax=Wolfiporia cocos (strain MD-104) TaxID=742152 RepID=A0A2H3JHM0_WOLCO|nr:hypothetical protein WOLCODRAFT_24914 [Wolfiporia cocos MD-104 SS10]
MTQLHPTLRQAETLLRNFSNRDKREMSRIAKLRTDAEVFTQQRSWTPRYRDMWREWLERKGADIAIVIA